MAPSAACECGAEEQTAGHVVLQCPIHWPLHQLHGLTVQDVETTQWMLNTCPEIQCDLAADCQNSLKRWRRNAFDADRTNIVYVVWIMWSFIFQNLSFISCTPTKISTAYQISQFEAVVSNIVRFRIRLLPCTSLIFWYRLFVSHWLFAPVFMLCFAELHRCWRR